MAVTTRLADLLRRAGQDLRQNYMDADRTGLTPDRVVVLRELAARGPLSQKALVRLTGIDRSTLSAMIVSMARDGLLTLSRTQDDRRLHIAAISAKGQTDVKSATQTMLVAEQLILQRIKKAKRAELITLLHELADLHT